MSDTPKVPATRWAAHADRWQHGDGCPRYVWMSPFDLGLAGDLPNIEAPVCSICGALLCSEDEFMEHWDEARSS